MLRYKTGNILVGFLFVLLIFAGCTNPEKKISRTLENAKEARANGNVNQAIQLLSSLNERFPGEADVLEALGIAYQEEPDPFASAIHLQQAVEADPTRTHLLKLVAENYAAVGDSSSARAAYEIYLQDFPEDGEATMALADLYHDANQIQSALDTYLKGFRLLDRPLRGDEAVTVGDLFFQVENYAQAENYYQAALESGDLSELPALFGLLKINVATTNWPVAERIVERIDSGYPGALDASDLHYVRDDLNRWREARAKFENEQRAQELAASQQRERLLIDELTSPTLAQSPTRPQFDESGNSNPTPPPEQEREPDAEESEGAEPDPEEAGGPPPSQGKLAQINDASGNRLEIFPEEENNEPESPENGLKADLRRARQYRNNGNYSEAVRLLWNILGRDPSLAEAWFELSKAYLGNNESDSAETASLEAMRLNPESPEYTLHHIDVIRQSRGRSVVLRELRMAYQRFPQNPDILFELGRGYEELANDPRNAAYIYNQFLDDSPNHPLAAEVRDRLGRLGSY